MGISVCILIGIGLAMDCFAVSLTQGLAQARWHYKAVLMALLFGLFQGGMPLIGFFAGNIWSEFFSRWSPMIALGLLMWIGGKMLIESFEEKDEKVVRKANWGFGHLIALSVATSIDALATGVIFIPCPEMLWMGIGIIAICSFVFALMGYGAGMILGRKFPLKVEIIGGLILIGIGIKIFVEGRGWELLH